MILWGASLFEWVVASRECREIYFCWPCEKGTVCKTNVYVRETLNLSLNKAFLSNSSYPPVIANKALYWIDSNLSWNDWSKLMPP